MKQNEYTWGISDGNRYASACLAFGLAGIPVTFVKSAVII